MPHEVVAVAVRAKLALYDFVAGITKIVGYFIGGGFESCVYFL
jgi:hypothetical protein